MPNNPISFLIEGIPTLIDSLKSKDFSIGIREYALFYLDAGVSAIHKKVLPNDVGV